MRAVSANAFGDPSVLSVGELPDPAPGPGEVTIDVTHAAVGMVDLFFRQGLLEEPRHAAASVRSGTRGHRDDPHTRPRRDRLPRR